MDRIKELTPKARVLTSFWAVVPGFIGTPILMSTWAPLWATVSWWVVHVSIAVIAWIAILRAYEKADYWWSIGIGLTTGLLPVSAYVFAPGTEAIWIAGCIAILTLALEVSNLPYLKPFRWRTGPVILGILTTVAAVLEIGLVGLCLVPIFALIIHNAKRLMKDKAAMQKSVVEAESKSARAEEIAANDQLTGLFNRRGLVMELEKFREAGSYTVVMFDANRFKAINDAHGHGAGDQVLRGLATAIVQRLPAHWIVARQGGDEFVAIAPGHEAVDSYGICEPVDCHVSMFGQDTTITLGMSAGLVHSDGTDTVDGVLNKAGYAMRESKRLGVGVVPFDEDLAARFEWMLEISAADQHGLDPDTFDADFQVIVDAYGSVVGCEALCRWRRADGSTLQPDQFLPILSEAGRMSMLNKLMLEKGIAFAARLNDVDDPPFVSINIGPSHLGSSGLVPHIESLLATYEVDPGRVMIEITETEFLDELAHWRDDAIALQELGVRLAIDDFGVGYSNIDRLNTLPITELKFDRSLVSSVAGPLEEVLRGVVRFAQEAGISIVAEGIEEQAEFAAMSGIGVEFFQGFMFGRPMSADDVEARIRDDQADNGFYLRAA